MRGTVIKRGGTWSVVIDLGRDENGKRIRKWHSGFRTKRDAEKTRVELLSRVDRGEYVEPTKLTVGAFFPNEWLPAMRSLVRPATWDSYDDIIGRHIVPGFGPILLQRLSAGTLNAFYADKLEAGLSPKTVRNIHVVIRKGLSDAMRWGLVARNIADLADPPKLRDAGSRKLKTWSAQELRAFLDDVVGDRLYPAYLLAASTGMRRGEVLGPRWSDLDFETARLQVRQTVISVGYDIQFSTPKTARGRRSVALDDRTLAALRAHRKAQLEEHVALGPDYEDGDLIFCRENGTPIHPQSFSQAFERHVRASGLPMIRLHDLRHTWASLALQAGVNPKVVSERLGHATVAFTLDRYSHAIPALEADAADRVADLVFGGGA